MKSTQTDIQLAAKNKRPESELTQITNRHYDYHRDYYVLLEWTQMQKAARCIWIWLVYMKYNSTLI